MTPRRLALVSIAVVTVLCIVGVSVLAVAAGGSALAYQVNGNRVSQRDFDDRLHDIADSIEKQSRGQTTQQTAPDGTLTSSITATVLNVSVLRDLLRDAADEKGVKLSAADLDAGKQSASQQVQSFDQTPKSYQKVVVEFLAYANALGLSDTDALNAFVAKQVKTADVYINPRYGTWNPRTGVCAPTGCSTTG
jgi:hypothetical protein